jgi:Peptidase_C39 like family
MRKFIAAFLLLLVFSQFSFAQISIEKEDRVENSGTGYCAWDCLETLGRYHKIKSLYKLAENKEKDGSFTWFYHGNDGWVKYYAPATVEAVNQTLKKLQVRYSKQDSGNYDKTIVKEAIKNKKGCMVVVKCWLTNDKKPIEYKPGMISYNHAIVIVDYDDEGVHFFDPNDIEHIYTGSHEWFNYYWTGYTIVIEK